MRIIPDERPEALVLPYVDAGPQVEATMPAEPIVSVDTIRKDLAPNFFSLIFSGQTRLGGVSGSTSAGMIFMCLLIVMVTRLRLKAVMS